MPATCLSCSTFIGLRNRFLLFLFTFFSLSGNVKPERRICRLGLCKRGFWRCSFGNGIIGFCCKEGFVLNCLKLCNQSIDFFTADGGDSESLAKIVQKTWINGLQPFTIPVLFMGLDAPRYIIEW